MKNVRTSHSIPHAEYFPRPGPRMGRGGGWVLRDEAREMTKFWPVVQNMVVQDLRVRYHRSVLGFFWTLLNPILMMATLTVVFSQLFGDNNWRHYAIYLFAGQVPWTLFAGSLNECSQLHRRQREADPENLPAKTDLPAVQVLINLTTFVLSLVALYFLVWMLGTRFSPADGRCCRS